MTAPVPAAEPADPPRLLPVVWGLLLVNVLGFLPSAGTVIPIPKAGGQVITMGALAVAFGLALLMNPRIRVRPSAYLVLLAALALVAVASSMLLESGAGALLRTARLVVFVATLWLIGCWWRPDLVLVRTHLRAIGGVLLVVLLGIVVTPGPAFSGPDGRLVGALWPIPAPQVGQYCAVAIGLAVLLGIAGRLRGRDVLLVVAPAVVMLLLSHTRTALAGLVAGLAVAVLSMVASDGRARRALLGAAAVGLVGAVVVGDAVLTWLARGQDADELVGLTGRQKVWDALLAVDRTPREQLLGIGLTDKSFRGLAIDSSWLSAYHELGILGVAITAAMLLVLLGVALLRPPGPARACALFLVVYCAVASYTEVGLSDASAYLLHLAVAASLLVPGPSRAVAPPGPVAVPVAP
ncbi:O-antigen ligase domain-containing protein [Pseudonocardia broussonetiae]|uniref:O-antigen ligase domain-containing protein n=1 Tax=Pseudonocardia broussonetiae TaxID=2736640 RepID=A0A6M6JK70_9PSEU|nr:O-antigen ligase domain-containing protein [Pseudonocardia broussonetiae]QJY47032.1 O-antigen ligase domain-containing protein [Pseudonocardia broussonetiae]